MHASVGLGRLKVERRKQGFISTTLIDTMGGNVGP